MINPDKILSCSENLPLRTCPALGDALNVVYYLQVLTYLKLLKFNSNRKYHENVNREN
jgi:hypothetical protein